MCELLVLVLVQLRYDWASQLQLQLLVHSIEAWCCAWPTLKEWQMGDCGVACVVGGKKKIREAQKHLGEK